MRRWGGIAAQIKIVDKRAIFYKYKSYKFHFSTFPTFQDWPSGAVRSAQMETFFNKIIDILMHTVHKFMSMILNCAANPPHRRNYSENLEMSSSYMYD